MADITMPIVTGRRAQREVHRGQNPTATICVTVAPCIRCGPPSPLMLAPKCSTCTRPWPWRPALQPPFDRPIMKTSAPHSRLQGKTCDSVHTQFMGVSHRVLIVFMHECIAAHPFLSEL